MAALSMGGTRVDGMPVVEASANRIAFNDLVTHYGSLKLHAGLSDCTGLSEGKKEDSEARKPTRRVRGCYKERLD